MHKYYYSHSEKVIVKWNFSLLMEWAPLPCSPQSCNPPLVHQNLHRRETLFPDNFFLNDCANISSGIGKSIKNESAEEKMSRVHCRLQEPEEEVYRGQREPGGRRWVGYRDRRWP